MERHIMAIDPGCTFSAYVVMDRETYKPVEFEKVENNDLLARMAGIMQRYWVDHVVIEKVASYGMAVGREVFDTCEWTGRFHQKSVDNGVEVDKIFRMEEKTGLCHSTKANDSTIRQALIDRFAKHDLKNGKGTKNDPDWFYGFMKDVWAAYAVGTVWIDKNTNKMI